VREERSKTQADAASSTSAHSRGQARDASLFWKADIGPVPGAAPQSAGDSVTLYEPATEPLTVEKVLLML